MGEPAKKYSYEETSVTGAQAQFHYVGFWMRFVAVIIDTLIVFVVHLIKYMILPGLLLETLISLALGFLYFAYFESSPSQGTPGKILLGLKVIDLQGNRLSFQKATIRYLGKIVSFLILGIGFIMAGFTQKKQALHDFISGTFVVKK